MADFKLIQRFVFMHQISFEEKKFSFLFWFAERLFDCEEENVLKFTVLFMKLLVLQTIEFSVVGKRIDGKTLFGKCEWGVVVVDKCVVNIVYDFFKKT